MTTQELLIEAERIAETGDMKVLERFMLDRFEELPEDVQGQLLLNMYAEAIEGEAGKVAVSQLQIEGMDALKQIGQAEQELKAV